MEKLPALVCTFYIELFYTWVSDYTRFSKGTQVRLDGKNVHVLHSEIPGNAFGFLGKSSPLCDLALFPSSLRFSRCCLLFRKNGVLHHLQVTVAGAADVPGNWGCLVVHVFVLFRQHSQGLDARTSRVRGWRTGGLHVYGWEGSAYDTWNHWEMDFPGIR